MVHQAIVVVLSLLLATSGVFAETKPIKPLGSDGKPLNLDFETGTLKDWTASGNAFDGQPVRGDTVFPRRGDMHSNHQGQYWIGGYEIKGDDATGTLTSVPFKVSHPWASFLVAGGAWPETRVELVRADTKEVFFKVSGYESETLRPVVVDLSRQLGQQVFIRLVDERTGGWGHINFDDFEFYDQRPQFSDELNPNQVSPQPLPLDEVKHAGLSPQDAPAAITLPEGFHVQLFAAEPDIVQPIAFTTDQRGRVWVVEGMTYPRRAPEGQGKDRILIFEDSTGAGHFTKRTVFAEGLNLVSGIEVGFGGVYVGAAPYLLFIPVTNWDDPKPAGPPQVLLDGFGYDDTHETLNTFTWGPDGWLYGCHGVFTQSFVGAPGTPRNKRVHINAGIFRYHPTKHVFERFAEGTSNPWGLDFDANGQMITEACVIPHLWHIIQGGHYMRQAGQHDNPFVFDDIKTIADHLHWSAAPNPWAANGRSAASGGGHAHAGMLVYQGASWPKEYDGQYFMNNIHGSRINMDVPEAKGSGFVGHHGKDFLLFNDTWARVVNLRSDQDGSVYMIDWYDAQHCHQTDPNAIDRSNGRIYKVVYGKTKTTQVSLDKLVDRELLDLQHRQNQGRENVWYSRTARRILQERAAAGKLDGQTRPALSQIALSDRSASHRLNALWDLHVTGGVSQDIAQRVFQANHPYEVAWMIQLLCEDKNPPTWAVEQFGRLAHESNSPVVRLYLACACQRMKLDQAWDVVTGLLSHREDAADHNLPLMDWYALEPLAGAHPSRALDLAMNCRLPNILSFTVRRIGAIGDQNSITALATSLGKAPDDAQRLQILSGLDEALRGRRSVPMPQGWEPISQTLLKSANEEVKARTLALSVIFGDKQAARSARQLLLDPSAQLMQRQAALDALLAIKDPQLPPILRKLLSDAQFQAAAVRDLAQYDDPEAARAIVAAYSSFNSAAKKDAIATLASRPSYAMQLLDAVGKGTIPPREVPAQTIRQLRDMRDPKIDQQVTRVWGTLRDSPQDKLNRMAELRKIVESPGPAPDLARGRELFNKTCSQCHTLFDTGGHVGPDITGSNRADLAYLLQHVVDPNAVIPNEYRPMIVKTTDDRTVVGIIKKEDGNAITLQTANEVLTIPRSEIAVQKISPLGMMPEGLLDNFPRQDIRDLIAYLRSPAQVPLASGR